MAPFELRFKPSVAKDLRGIPKTEVRRLLKRIEALGDDPRPAGCEDLTGRDLYRIRQGVYRIVYSVDDAAVVIDVIKVGHRREVYRSPRSPDPILTAPIEHPISPAAITATMVVNAYLRS